MRLFESSAPGQMKDHALIIGQYHNFMNIPHGNLLRKEIPSDEYNDFS